MKKRPWERFPEQSNDLDQNTHWSIQQGWMAIFLPFVPVAAIAAVLSQVTDVDLLAKYEEAQGRAMQAEGVVAEICKELDRPCSEITRHIDRISNFKGDIELVHLSNAKNDITDWWAGKERAAMESPRKKRLKIVEERLQEYVAEQMKMKPGDLETGTGKEIERASGRILKDLDLELWTKALRNISPGNLLTQCALNENPGLGEDERKAGFVPKIREDVVTRVAMTDYPSGEEAASLLDGRVEELYTEELERRRREDREIAQRVTRFSFRNDLNVCVALDHRTAREAVENELVNASNRLPEDRTCWGFHTNRAFGSKVNARITEQLSMWDHRLGERAKRIDHGDLGEMEPRQRSDLASFEEQTRIELHAILGIDQCPSGWEETLPETWAAIAQRAEDHGLEWQRLLETHVEQAIRELETLDAMDRTDRAALIPVVANLSMGRETLDLSVAEVGRHLDQLERTPSFAEVTRSFATNAGLAEMFLVEEDWSRFREHTVGLLTKEAEDWRARVVKAIKQAPLPPAAQAVRPSDHARRDELVSNIAGEILTGVESTLSDQASNPRDLRIAQALAEKRAGEIFDRTLVVSGDAVHDYAEPRLATRISMLSPERLSRDGWEQTRDQVIRGIFPVPENHAVEGIRATTYEDLDEEMVARLEKAATEQIQRRVEELLEEARDRIREIHEVSAFALVTLENRRNEGTAVSAKAAANREIRSRIGPYGQLAGVDDAVEKQVEKLFTEHNERLLHEEFEPVLRAQTLRGGEYRDPCDLKELDGHLGEVAEALIDRTIEMLEIGDGFVVDEEIRSIAEGRARDLLEARLDEVVQEQLDTARDQEVSVAVYDVDTIDSLLDRELEAIFEKVPCILPKVEAKVREERHKGAQIRIARKDALLASWEETKDEIVSEGETTAIGRWFSGIADKTQRFFGRKRSIAEIEKLAHGDEAKLQGIRESKRVAEHAADVPIPDIWFSSWSDRQQEDLERNPLRNLHFLEYRTRILRAAGLTADDATDEALGEAERQAKAGLIQYGKEMLTKTAVAERDRREAERLKDRYAPQIERTFTERFAQGEPVLRMEGDDLKAEIFDELAEKHISLGVREQLAELLLGRIEPIRKKKENEVKAEISSWQRGRIEGNPEALLQVYEELDHADISPGDQIPEPVQEKIMIVLKEMFKQEAGQAELLELYSDDLEKQARKIGEQMLGMISSGGYDRSEIRAQIASRQAAGTTGSPPSGSSGPSGTPGTPAPAPGQGPPPTPGKMRPRPVPPAAPPTPTPTAPIDLVIAIQQPSANRSTTEVTVWEYFREASPNRAALPNSYLGPLTRKDDLELDGSPNEQNFRRWAEELRIWLSGTNNGSFGLAGAVDSVFRQSSLWASQMNIRVHVAIAGEALPHGFLRLISEEVVPHLAQRFQQRNQLQSMAQVSWTTWDPETGERLVIGHDPNNLAPPTWPSTR